MNDQPVSLPFRDVREALLQRELWESLMQKAQIDPVFRAQFLAYPAQVIRREGYRLPPNVEVTVIEYDPNQAIVLLPPLQQL